MCRKITAFLLALLLAAAVCVPALAADQLTRVAPSQGSELEGLEDLMGIRQKIQKDSYYPNEIKKKLGTDPSLANTADTVSLLLDDTNWVNDVVRYYVKNDLTTMLDNLKAGDSLTVNRLLSELKDMEAARISRQIEDRDMVETAFPEHWTEVTRPSPEFQTQTLQSKLGKNGLYSLKNGLDSIGVNKNNYVIYYGDRVEHFNRDQYQNLLLYPRMNYVGRGYAILFMQVFYVGNRTATINGISKIVISNRDGSKVYAGGYTDPQYFDTPIRLYPNETTYFALIFDPTTWNDMAFEDASDSMDYQCTITISNPNWES